MTEADIQLPIAAPDIRAELETIDGFAIEDARVRLLRRRLRGKGWIPDARGLHCGGRFLLFFFLEPRAEANMLPSSEPPSSRITPSPASSLILLLSLLSNDFATCLQPGSLTNCYSLKEEIKKMDPYDLKKLESLTAPRASCSGCRCATCSQVRLIYRTEEPSHSSNLYHTHFFNLSYYLILLAQM